MTPMNQRSLTACPGALPALSRRLLPVILLMPLLIILMQVLPAGAADRMYFGALAEQNSASGTPQVLITWGELEGTISTDIIAFNLYRRTSTSDYKLLATLPNTLLSSTAMRPLFYETGEDALRTELITALTDIDGTTNETNFHTVLHGLIDPDSASYNALQTMLLTRMNRDVARARARGYLDTSVSGGAYTYMLTAILGSKAETSPLGIVEIDSSIPTLLPAPQDFRQVRVGACSLSRKNLDHARIHLNWDVPTSAETMAERSLTYGYDVYRSLSYLGTLNLRNAIPAGLVKVNETPIIASGNSPTEGSDAYLASDDGGALDGEAGLQPGTIIYYYLVARDVAGHYSATSGPLKAIVPDTVGPVMPWNVHARQEMVDSGSGPEPRMSLVWDRINGINYLKNYQYGKTICSSSPSQVCYVKEGESCTATKPFCVDLAVAQYLVYRFDSFEEASQLGGDRDGDYWPDELEDLNEDGVVDPGETDPCDGTVYPSGLPTSLIARIPWSDTSAIRTLDDNKQVQFFLDPTPAPDNKVYWYRIAARDKAGNESPISPPARAALWDRSQPNGGGSVRTQKCRYYVSNHDYNEGGCKPEPNGDEHVVLSVIDETGEADSFTLYEYCNEKDGGDYKEIYHGQLINGRSDLSPEEELKEYLSRNSCKVSCGLLVVRFFSASGQMLRESDPIQAVELCDSTIGCVTYGKDCEWSTVTDTGGGDIVDDGGYIQVCADLEVGECARVYQRINGEMSPVGRMYEDLNGTPARRICRNSPTDDPCRFIDIQTIVPSDVCFGLRTFSKNNVGSKMHYLPCVTVASAPPEPPIMEEMESTGTAADPAFTVNWSAQPAGMAAFILKVTTSDRTFYETAWGLEPDSSGLYQTNIPIKSTEITENVCIRARGIDSALQMSDWSAESVCKVWGEAEEPENLPWPTVPLPPETASIMAFVPGGEKIGVLVLSDDLTQAITTWAEGSDRCVEEPERVPTCTETRTCLNAIRFDCSICGRLANWNKFGKFMVYRQEENKDFVQVGPLVDKIQCYKFPKTEKETFTASLMDDPLIFLTNLEASAITGTTTTVKAALVDTFRLVYADWYPNRSGSKVRYKLVRLSQAGLEPDEIFTSNWISIP